MSISLYDISVTNYLQILGSTSVILDKGKTYAEANNIALSTLVDSRLVEAMLPLSFQIVSTAHHSLGAIEGLRTGVFNPPPRDSVLDYDDLHGLITAAIETMKKISPDEINALAGGDMRFESGDFKLPFTAEGFIQSFSLPNFFFHATTVYDLLRMKGVPLGKGDFLGQMQIKA